MNKGFLTFSDEEPGLTMLKDEPDDLTHLAPVAGDECVPLETSFMDDFEFFINAPDSYPLLTEELHCLSDSQSSSNSKGSTDPFFSYRDDLGSAGSPSDLSHSHLGSPSHSKSPGDCSLPSLCSPGIPSDEDQMAQFMSLNMDSSPEADDELSMRAPYIPMGDDLPLLISDDLMWGSSISEKSLADDGWPPVPGSNMVHLMNSDSQTSPVLRCRSVIKCNDHGGGIVDSNDILDETFSNQNSMDWVESPRPADILNSNSRVSSKEGLCITLKNIPPGVGPPDRCNKRAHEPGQNSVGTKRTKAENPATRQTDRALSSQLLQNLIKAQSTPAKGGTNTIPWTLHKGATTKAQQRQQRQQSQQQTQQQESPPQQQSSQCARQMQPPPQQPPPQPPRPPQQPSDSVLMNLLVSGCDENLSKLPAKNKFASEDPPGLSNECSKDPDAGSKDRMRKNSFSLLDPDSTTIPSLADLSEQDYEVNAPVASSSRLLQGRDLLIALETSSVMME